MMSRLVTLPFPKQSGQTTAPLGRVGSKSASSGYFRASDVNATFSHIASVRSLTSSMT